MRKFRGCFLINAAKVAPLLLEVLSHGVVGACPKKTSPESLRPGKNWRCENSLDALSKEGQRKENTHPETKAAAAIEVFFAMRARERETSYRERVWNPSLSLLVRAVHPPKADVVVVVPLSPPDECLSLSGPLLLLLPLRESLLCVPDILQAIAEKTRHRRALELS